MKKLLLWLDIALIPFILSCKKEKSDPEPEGIHLFDLTVYDSDLWTPQNKLPIAPNVEVEVYEMKRNLNYMGYWEETDSIKQIFTGKT